MSHYDLIVIGGGPGGYVAAIRAAQFGKDVALIEREPRLGGTCLRVGCIPSKALLESSALYEQARERFRARGLKVEVQLDLPGMLQHKSEVVGQLASGIDGLMQKNKITRYTGRGRFQGSGRIVVEGNEGATELTADNVIIATGSQPASLPGITFDGQRIVSSTEALDFESVPKTLVVIGAGYIGLELGTVWRRLGSQVIVLEYLDRILPGMDSGLAQEAQKIFTRQGIEFRLGSKVTGVRLQRKSCDVEIDATEPLRCDRVLLAVGRQPHTEGLGLETVNVTLNSRGFIEVNDHYETRERGVFAIGDVIGGAMLAHKAEEEGIACVERLYSGYGHVNYDAIPGVVYTEPEIATVGRTEEQLQEHAVSYKKGIFPFLASGRARASGATAGFIKVLAHAQTDRILGVHMIGPHVGELIGEAVAAIEFGASSEDLARCCHAHPTLAEALKEACLAVQGRAIHI